MFRPLPGALLPLILFLLRKRPCREQFVLRKDNPIQNG